MTSSILRNAALLFTPVAAAMAQPAPAAAQDAPTVETDAAGDPPEPRDLVEELGLATENPYGPPSAWPEDLPKVIHDGVFRLSEGTPRHTLHAGIGAVAAHGSRKEPSSESPTQPSSATIGAASLGYSFDDGIVTNRMDTYNGVTSVPLGFVFVRTGDVSVTVDALLSGVLSAAARSPLLGWGFGEKRPGSTSSIASFSAAGLQASCIYGGVGPSAVTCTAVGYRSLIDLHLGPLEAKLDIDFGAGGSIALGGGDLTPRPALMSNVQLEAGVRVPGGSIGVQGTFAPTTVFHRDGVQALTLGVGAYYQRDNGLRVWAEGSQTLLSYARQSTVVSQAALNVSLPLDASTTSPEKAKD